MLLTTVSQLFTRGGHTVNSDWRGDAFHHRTELSSALNRRTCMELGRVRFAIPRALLPSYKALATMAATDNPLLARLRNQDHIIVDGKQHGLRAFTGIPAKD